MSFYHVYRPIILTFSHAFLFKSVALLGLHQVTLNTLQETSYTLGQWSRIESIGCA